MKKKIYICMSILIVFILSLSIVRANTMDTNEFKRNGDDGGV